MSALVASFRHDLALVWHSAEQGWVFLTTTLDGSLLIGAAICFAIGAAVATLAHRGWLPKPKGDAWR